MKGRYGSSATRATRIYLRAAIETALITLGAGLLTAGLLWLSFAVEVDVSVSTLTNILTTGILGGFVFFLLLFVTLVMIQRIDHYERRPPSPLLLPLITSFGSIAAYFGFASLASLDWFHEPQKPWLFLRDDGIRLFAIILIIALVGTRAHAEATLLLGRGWTLGRVALLYAGGAGVTALVVWLATIL